jgi:hypothetical protein
MAKARSAAASDRAWSLAFVAGLVLAALFLLYPNSSWGPVDEGDLAYNYGVGEWGKRLRDAFLPPERKVFLFGSWRPVPYGLYFRFFTQTLGLSPFGHQLLGWLIGAGSALALAWGLVSLAGAGIRFERRALWLTALLLWLCPSALLLTVMVAPEYWLHPGLLGLFWGLLYAPGATRLRAAAAIVVGFLALQSHESVAVLMFWSSLLLAAIRARRRPADLPWRRVAVPAAVATAYALLYRSLSPSAFNRPEIATSLAPADLLRGAKHHLLSGTHALAEPFTGWLGLEPRSTGVTFGDGPWAFLLTCAGLVVALRSRAGRRESADARWERGVLWLLPLAGLVCTAPFFAMVNRYLYYYSVKLQILTAAFVALLLSRRGVPERRAAWGAGLYVAGLLVAAYPVLYEWNWIKQYGGLSRRFCEQVIAGQESRGCTAEVPCCLEISGGAWLWLYNVATVNWCDGGRYPPRFVSPGTSCARTIRVTAPGY